MEIRWAEDGWARLMTGWAENRLKAKNWLWMGCGQGWAGLKNGLEGWGWAELQMDGLRMGMRWAEDELD